MAQALGINAVTIWRWENTDFPPVPDWQGVILNRLAAYADQWEAEQRAIQASKRQGLNAGEVLAGIVIAGGLIGLAAALFADAHDRSKRQPKRRSSRKRK